jgi:hypothetical protein
MQVNDVISHANVHARDIELLLNRADTGAHAVGEDVVAHVGVRHIPGEPVSHAGGVPTLVAQALLGVRSEILGSPAQRWYRRDGDDDADCSGRDGQDAKDGSTHGSSLGLSWSERPPLRGEAIPGPIGMESHESHGPQWPKGESVAQAAFALLFFC